MKFLVLSIPFLLPLNVAGMVGMVGVCCIHVLIFELARYITLATLYEYLKFFSWGCNIQHNQRGSSLVISCWFKRHWIDQYSKETKSMEALWIICFFPYRPSWDLCTMLNEFFSAIGLVVIFCMSWCLFISFAPPFLGRFLHGIRLLGEEGLILFFSFLFSVLIER